jgi:large subunit ribosomal protein L5
MSSITINSAQYYKDAVKKTADQLNIKNLFEAPSIKKISINIGVGKFENKQKQEIANHLEALTGQKPKFTKAKISVAGFKVRKNENVGLSLTLRGKAAQDFIIQLVYLGLPRTRDFRGIKSTSFDSKLSTYSIGVENTSIFPSIGFDVPFTFGMQVNVNFAIAGQANLELLKNLNFPFKK